MDELEKRIIQKYGTENIPSEEVDRILNQAAREGLIERKDIKPQPSMDASSLIEHISHLRRLFLINDEFHLNSEEDAYEALCCSTEKKDSKVDLNGVFKAYLEYEGLESKKKGGNMRNFAFLVLVLIGAYFSYTPRPY